MQHEGASVVLPLKLESISYGMTPYSHSLSILDVAARRDLERDLERDLGPASADPLIRRRLRFRPERLLQPTELHSSLPALTSSRHHPSNDDCLEDDRKNYQNCSVLCYVRQLCTMIQ